MCIPKYNFPSNSILLTTNKKTKILHNPIARKRLNKANFHNENIKLKSIDYICCIPINGYSSALLQDIRTSLNTYNFKVAQFTTKSFLTFLETNHIKLNMQDLPLFYIGQMLILTVNLSIADINVRQRSIIQKNCLTLLYSILQRISFCSLVYIANTQKAKYLVVQNMSSKFIENLPLYFNNSVHFSNLNNTLLGFINLLIIQILYLLNTLFLSSNKKITI